MSTVQITEENFQKTVKGPGIVVLDWWAPWCGPCRAFGPTFEKVSSRHPDIVFGKVNTEEEPELAGQFSIRSIPTLMLLRDNVLLFSQPGMLPEKALEELIQQARVLDMNKVRSEIDSHKKQAPSPAAGHA